MLAAQRLDLAAQAKLDAQRSALDTTKGKAAKTTEAVVALSVANMKDDFPNRMGQLNKIANFKKGHKEMTCEIIG